MNSYPEATCLITFILVSLIIIIKDIVINIYQKDKLRNNLLYNVKNFIRYCNSKSKNKYTMPSKIEKLYFISLANKFCVISIDFIKEELVYYDKLKDIDFMINSEILSEKQLENLFNKLCKQFNFETKIEDILAILKSVFFNIEKYIIELENYQQEKQMIKRITINNLSIAELIELPGINIGKANKIKKYTQSKSFRRLDDFISFAQIRKKDATEIRKMFNHDIRYIPQKREI